MSIRSQIAKLRQQTGSTQFNNDVRAISDLMDELSAAAAGGGSPRGEISLDEIFNDTQHPHRPDQGPYNQKVSQ